jgi:hypothetical protein
MSEPDESKAKLKLGDVTVTFPRVAAERMYEELKKVVGDGKLTTTNVVTVLVSLMQTVDGYVDLKGAQKKAVALAAVLHLIEDQVDDNTEKTQFKQLVLLTLPSVVDSFVKLDKKQLKIKAKKVITRFLGCCLPGKRPNESNFYLS